MLQKYEISTNYCRQIAEQPEEDPPSAPRSPLPPDSPLLVSRGLSPALQRARSFNKELRRQASFRAAREKQSLSRTNSPACSRTASPACSRSLQSLHIPAFVTLSLEIRALSEPSLSPLSNRKCHSGSRSVWAAGRAGRSSPTMTRSEASWTAAPSGRWST